MEFHIPGRPEDLPPFDVLWARAAALAALEAGGSENHHSYAGAVIHYDDRGGDECRLARIEGGRGVLVGADHHCDDHLDVEGFDPYAGPGWLPRSWLAGLENDREQGFVYWWDGAVWERIDYPGLIEDDGLGSLLAHLSTPEKAAERVLNALDLRSSSEEWRHGAVLVHRVLELAQAGPATEAQWRDALNGALEYAAQRDSQYIRRPADEFDPDAAVDVARATGLVSGFEAAAMPAGTAAPRHEAVVVAGDRPRRAASLGRR